jgi:hypothetical protein
MLTETNQNTGHPLTLDNGATVLGYTEFAPAGNGYKRHDDFQYGPLIGWRSLRHDIQYAPEVTTHE